MAHLLKAFALAVPILLVGVDYVLAEHTAAARIAVKHKLVVVHRQAVVHLLEGEHTLHTLVEAREGVVSRTLAEYRGVVAVHILAMLCTVVAVHMLGMLSAFAVVRTLATEHSLAVGHDFAFHTRPQLVRTLLLAAEEMLAEDTRG